MFQISKRDKEILSRGSINKRNWCTYKEKLNLNYSREWNVDGIGKHLHPDKWCFSANDIENCNDGFFWYLQAGKLR